MPATSNVMTVSNKGLSAIGKAIIDAHKYTGDGLTLRGHVLVSGNGITSRYSSNNYIVKSGVHFIGSTTEIDPGTGETITVSHPIKIDIAGKFLSGNTGRNTMFTLVGNNNLRVYVDSNVASVYSYNKSVIDLTGFKINDYDEVQCSLTVSLNYIKLEVTVNGVAYSKTANPDGVTPSSFTGIFIGLDYTPNSPNFWKGSLDLSKFFVYEDGELYYSPTVPQSIEFESIIIAESTIELTDNSTAVVGMAYEFPITEVTKSGDNILLKAKIESDVYLTIGKIGLYCTIDGERRLFSELRGLNLKKTRDLSYDLIIYVNTTVQFVNTNVYPEIALKEDPFVKKLDFERIKKVFLNANTDLERAIEKNSELIGYNKPQVFYKHEQNLKIIEDNWFNTSAYLKMISPSYNYVPLNFFPFIKNTYNSYDIKDLVTFNELNAIKITDGSFKGDLDSIKFLGSATLSVVLDISDLSDRILLAKVRFGSTPEDTFKYFVLSLENLSIKFSFYTETSVENIVVPLSFEDQLVYNHPTLISIVQSTESLGCKFSIYQNTKLLGSEIITNPAYINPYSYFDDPSTGFYLTNYTTGEELEVAEVCLRNIMFFNRTLSPTDLYRLKCILAINS